MPASGPTLFRRQLGRRLAALREAARVTTQQVEDAGIASKPMLWRIEDGRQRVGVDTVSALCALYRVTPPAIVEELLALARRTAERGLWHQFRATVPSWFRLYVDLESAASRITTWDDSVVPGELQTPGYAWALWRGARPDLSDEQIAPHLQLRQQRQQALFDRVPSVRLTVTLGENALRRPVGGPQILAEQVAHLRELDRRDDVDIRYLPMAAGAHRGTNGPFRILQFQDPQDPDLVYLESEVTAHYLEKPEHLEAYRLVSAALRAAARPIGDLAP